MNRAAILVSLLMAGPAFGHDIYKDWKAQSGASCCSERKEHPSGDVTGDCRPVRAVQDMNGSESCFMALSLLKVLRAGLDTGSVLCARGPLAFRPRFRQRETRSPQSA